MPGFVFINKVDFSFLRFSGIRVSFLQLTLITMKKFFLFPFIILLAACMQDDSFSSVEDIDLSDSYSIESRALALMDEFYGPETKAGRRFPEVCSLRMKTKSSGGTVSANVVNFKNNEGFVVMTTDENNNENLIAISNNGNLDTLYMKNAINESESSEYAGDTTNIQWCGEIILDDEVDDDESEPYYDSDPLYSSVTNTRFITDDSYAGGVIEEEGAPGSLIVEHKLVDMLNTDLSVDGSHPGNQTRLPLWSDWKFHSGVAPIIKTKWGQEYPYNNHCPIKKGERAPAGCVAIAVGQIAAYFQRPSDENWSVISSFGTKDNSDYDIPEENEIVATYIRSLGDKLWMNYGADNSGSNIFMAKRYVRKHMGFKDARVTKWDWERAKGRLEKNIPVYTRGKGPDGGHAWIVDGYVTQRSYDYNKVFSDRYRTLIHINWGWYGNFDGYYHPGVFDTTTRIFKDSDLGDRDNSDHSKFDKKNKILTWSAQ